MARFAQANVMRLKYYFVTSLIVASGVFLGSRYVEPSPIRGHTFDYRGEAYANWDGQWYKQISRAGYDYRPGAYSSVAFFPAYPLVGRGMAYLTGARHEVALVLASNLFLACAFCLMGAYVEARAPAPGGPPAGLVLLAMGLIPTTFFFRMAYSESMFLLITVTVLYGIERGWPPAAVAVVIGLATATRPVGVALIPCLVVLLWRRSRSLLSFSARAALLVPLACWGIAAYLAFQQSEFGDCLVFMKAQQSWRLRPPSTPVERLTRLATLEPVVSFYDPSGAAYLATFRSRQDPPFSLRSADPVYFLGAVYLCVLGAARRWTTRYETLAAAGLLAIPYVSVGYDQYMQSMGRYSLAAVPVYIVLARLLERVPPPALAALAGFGGLLLGTYAALFSAWYVVL